MMLEQFQNVQLTNDQREALGQLEQFLAGDGRVFILQGYAGTGKTTLLGGLVRHLVGSGKAVQLMAPTGRAAKVLKDRTGIHASTVHRGIYSFDSREVLKDEETGDEVDYRFHFRLAQREVAGMVFIVDEASMLSDAGGQNEHIRYGSGRLLTDLIEFTKMGNTLADTKLIFVGDPVQLPPVTDNESKALCAETLKTEFGLHAQTATLKQVVRTAEASGVMLSAQRIRTSYTAGSFSSFDVSPNGQDVHHVGFDELVSAYLDTPSPRIALTYKNATAQEINDRVRERIFGKGIGRELRSGDQVVFTANNYRTNVLNGEFAVVAETFPNEPKVVRNIPIRLKGGDTRTLTLEWQHAAFHVPEGDGMRVLQGFVLNNCLRNTDGGLSPDEYLALYIDFKMRNGHLKENTVEFRDALLSDPYYNAFRLTYGYAVTCHKAQGGEWDSVLILWDYGITNGGATTLRTSVTQGMTNGNFYRWAYTAVTRSAKQLFHVNAPYFHPYLNLSFVEDTVQRATVTLAPANAAQVITLPFDAEAISLVGRFGASAESNTVQDHLIRVNHLLEKESLRLQGWKKAQYEITYHVVGQSGTAYLKFWLKGDGSFGPRHHFVPVGVHSPELQDCLTGLARELANVVVIREQEETGAEDEEHVSVKREHAVLETDVAERQPYLAELHGCLATYFNSESIVIVSIEHLQHRERYRFARGSALATMDFEYNEAGFFGRVLPLYGSHPDAIILESIRGLVNQLRTK
jgi:hypothetical protein